MLTIQPKITQYAQQRNNVSFKSSEAIGIPDDSFYRDKQDYYENQIRYRSPLYQSGSSDLSCRLFQPPSVESRAR